MTIAAAWVRRINNCEELIFTSDSRLSGGRNIDCCQKILSLPRSDSAICFAGGSQFAYPLMQQAITSIISYGRAKDRSLDLFDFKGHLLKVFNNLLPNVSSSLKEMEVPDASFIFGGYSWQSKVFELWTVKFDKNARSFVAVPANRWTRSNVPIAFAGDMWKTARDRLIQVLRDRHGIFPNSDVEFGFDWEPFEVVRDLLREEAQKEANSLYQSTIGGAPQIVKIYQHMNCRLLGVYWPSRDDDRVCIAGREILPYERPDIWILDPDNKRSSHLLFTPADTTMDEEANKALQWETSQPPCHLEQR